MHCAPRSTNPPIVAVENSKNLCNFRFEIRFHSSPLSAFNRKFSLHVPKVSISLFMSLYYILDASRIYFLQSILADVRFGITTWRNPSLRVVGKVRLIYGGKEIWTWVFLERKLFSWQNIWAAIWRFAILSLWCSRTHQQLSFWVCVIRICHEERHI